MMIDHDRLFKELISTFFREFVALFLPDVMAQIEPASLILIDKEIFTDVTSGERYEADLVARGELKNQASSFIVHIEHQSRSEANFGMRMFRYFARLHEKHALKVYPVVVFSYNAPKRPEPNTYQVEFLGDEVMTFKYRVIQLNRLSWQDFVHQENPVACAFMAKMQMDVQERPIVKLECLRMLSRLGLNAARTQLISGFVDTYLRLNAEEEAVFRAELNKIAPEEQEEVMEIVTSWMEKGIEQGLQEGRRQEARSLVLRQLVRRLGSVTPELEAVIRQLSILQLEELAEALLDFSHEADLEAWLRDRTS